MCADSAVPGTASPVIRTSCVRVNEVFIHAHPPVVGSAGATDIRPRKPPAAPRLRAGPRLRAVPDGVKRSGGGTNRWYCLNVCEIEAA
jgi:hypothetical protein